MTDNDGDGAAAQHDTARRNALRKALTIGQLDASARRWHWCRVVPLNIVACVFLWGVGGALVTHEWRSTPAVVVNTEVVHFDFGSCIVIHYRYTVSGHTYDGQRFRPSGQCAHFVPGYVERFPPGKPLKVYYDIDDPSFAALVPAFEWGAVGTWFAVLAFFAMWNAFFVYLTKYRAHPELFDD